MSCCKKKPAAVAKSLNKEVAVFMDNANDGDFEALMEIYNGENVNKVDLLTYVNKRAGATALHLAANNGHVEIVQFILEMI